MRFSILYGLSVSRYARGEHDEALRNGQPFVDLAEAASETAPAVVANRSHAAALWIVGDVDRAQIYFDRAAELFDPAIHLGLANQYGQDLGVATYGVYTVNYMWRGKTRQALKCFEQCQRFAAITDSIVSKCYMHLMGQFVSEYTDDARNFADHTNTMSHLANEYGVGLFQLYSGMASGMVKMDQGQDSYLKDVLEYETKWVATPTKLLFPTYRLWAAKRAFRFGLMKDAIALADRSKALMDQTGENHARADHHQFMAKIALHDGDTARAEECLMAAIKVAKRQGAKLFELRAANDLAPLMAETGRGAEARSILLPIHESIEDGDCPVERAVSTRLLEDLNN